MRLFSKMEEPIFLKESSNLKVQLEKLKALKPLLNVEGQNIIKQDIKYLEYGIIGENNIKFELKNSHMPMYILHDICLEHGDFTAQIDYLVFTKKICFIIECKNLYGDIEINNSGNFIRTIEFGGRKKKEGIYSPITQNHRHLELMKKIRLDDKNTIFTKYIIEKNFENANKAVVVLANAKTVLNVKYAKKEVKEEVIRADQLIKYIEYVYKNSKATINSEDKMLAWAQYYLNLHRDVERDYTRKYEQYKIKMITPQELDKGAETLLRERQSIITHETKVEETDIFKELKEYRLYKSREERIKPYLIYSNNQLKDLILKRPRNKKELQAVSGFGVVKSSKYGDDILEIIKKY